jgi:hypothetical protein
MNIEHRILRDKRLRQPAAPGIFAPVAPVVWRKNAPFPRFSDFCNAAFLPCKRLSRCAQSVSFCTSVEESTFAGAKLVYFAPLRI